MKIAILVSEFNINGGTQRLVAELAYYLKNKGNKVTIYTDNYSEDCYPHITENIKIKFLSKDKKEEAPPRNKILLYPWKIKHHFFKTIQNYKNTKKLIKIIDKDTEILNCHGLDVDLAAFLFSQRHKTPFIWHIHDMHRCFRPIEESKIKRLLLYALDLPEILLEKRIAKAAKVITVCVSKNKALVKKHLGREALVFYPGVDIDKFSFRGVKEFSKIPEMLSIGIMYPVRKYEILIKAIKTLKDKNINLHLTILGSSRNCPAYAREIKNLVKSLNLKRDVTFLEEVEEKELIELYDKADLFAFINHRQSWGNVVFEAMAVGVPVIVSKTVGAVEVLEHKKNAFIVPPNDAGTTARAIEELLNNKMLYKKLVENGRRLVENMSWEKMYCEKVWNLFKEIHA